mgnify:CR=1 FL=1
MAPLAIPGSRYSEEIFSFLWNINRVGVERRFDQAVGEGRVLSALYDLNQAILVRDDVTSKALMDRHYDPLDKGIMFVDELVRSRWCATFGNPSDVVVHLDLAEALAEGGHALVLAALLHRQGHLARKRSEYARSISMQLRAEATFQEHGWILDAAFCRVEIGSVLLINGDVAAATTAYLAALDVVEKEGSSRQTQGIRANVAATLQRTGDHGRAKVMLREALAQPPFDSPSTGRAILLQNLAVMEKIEQQHVEALRLYDEALACIDATPPTSQFIRLIVGKAELLVRIGKHEEARNLVESISMDDVASASAVARVEVYSLRGRIHGVLDSPADAAHWFELASATAYEHRLYEERANVLREHLVIIPGDDERYRARLLQELADVQTQRLDEMSGSIGRIVDFRASYERQLGQIEVERQQEKTRVIIETQDRVSRSIARDLHDSVGQDLTILRLLIDQLGRGEQLSEQSMQDVMVRAREKIVEVANDVRRISHELSNTVLESQGLAAAMQILVQDTALAVNGLSINYGAHGDIDTIHHDLARCLYRCAQSLLQNVLRHANATVIEMQLIVHESTVDLSIEDNGTGFDVGTTSKGLGLREVAARVGTYGGTLHLDTTVGHGTFTHVSVPLAEATTY